MAFNAYYSPLSPTPAMRDLDVIVGQQTDTAVRAFQKSKGLKPDGIVGPATRAALGI